VYNTNICFYTLGPKTQIYVNSAVLTAMNGNITLFCDVTPCSLVYMGWQSSILKTYTPHLCETSINFFQVLKRFVPKGIVPSKNSLNYDRFQASAAKCIRTPLFWVIMQRVLGIPYLSFGTTYRVPSLRSKNQP
jgi:hypothetical protein